MHCSADESLTHEDGLSVRRSTRQRRFTYDTFNQNLMGDAASMESTEIDESNIDRETQEEATGRPKRTHRRTEVEPVPITEVRHFEDVYALSVYGVVSLPT